MRRQDESARASIGELISWGERCLGDAGLQWPRREARLLLGYALGVDAASMRLRDRRAPVEPSAGDAFRAAVRRRAAREPLARITGRQGFWTLELAVSGATLIPRADSEALIESLLALRPDRRLPLRMLDLGTGTGCLLLAALSEYPRAWGVGVDREASACRLAASNAAAAGLRSRSALLCGCWSDALSAEGGGFDLVLSNPPYIRTRDISGLMPEVSRFEPRPALDGGADGLDAYRAILSRLAGLLAADGVAIIELGAGQLEAVRTIAGAAGLATVSLRADLAGVPRALALRRS